MTGYHPKCVKYQKINKSAKYSSESCHIQVTPALTVLISLIYFDTKLEYRFSFATSCTGINI